MHGLLRLQEKIRSGADPRSRTRDPRPDPIAHQRLPRLPIVGDSSRSPNLDREQIESAASLGWWDELNLDKALQRASREAEEERKERVNGGPQS